MARVIPVILCGGAGSRLWPASRAWRPKPFVALTGPRSGFQQTVLRAAGLAGAGDLLVVAGEAHRSLVEAQLAELGLAAELLLETQPRDTGPAIAAAALRVASSDPETVLAILPADHDIPDARALADAIAIAAAAAQGGVIVTLGLRPQGASTDYGYIRPAPGEGVRPVAGFVEKPDAARAAVLVAEGCLWNSGIFVASAATLLEEIAAHAPALTSPLLNPPGGAGPRISFDRAVMEKTHRAAVLPVDFAWSDLGGWPAIWAASPRDDTGSSLEGDVALVAARDVLVRAPPGVRVAVANVSRLAVVVEPDAVLVCGLDAGEALRGLADLPPASAYVDLPAARAGLRGWLATAGLPVWATLGVDAADGGFREGLTVEGAVHDPRRRARVQARQAYVFAAAAAEGLPGPWLAVARRGFERFAARARRPDGLFANTLTPAGDVSDATARLYEHAFVLLALAALSRAEPGEPGHAAEAQRLLAGLAGFRHAARGFREADEPAFQANAQMHLFEAALAWEGAGGDAAWANLADELALLALDRFIDPDTGALQEVFDADWRPRPAAIEPGHQFEWAWLLERWGASRGEARAQATARRLHAAGRRGFDAGRGVVVNGLDAALSVSDAGARLWPQTEFLKAALILGEAADARLAANAIARFLATPVRGVWRERMRPDGGFVEEPAPATSLYHLTTAILELGRKVP